MRWLFVWSLNESITPHIIIFLNCIFFHLEEYNCVVVMVVVVIIIIIICGCHLIGMINFIVLKMRGSKFNFFIVLVWRKLIEIKSIKLLRWHLFFIWNMNRLELIIFNWIKYMNPNNIFYFILSKLLKINIKLFFN